MGLFTTGKNKNWEKYGGISPNSTIFTIQHTLKMGIIMTGKNKAGKNMAEFVKTRHIIPAIIIPSKVIVKLELLYSEYMPCHMVR